MSIYYLLLAVVLINGIFFGKKRKWYVFSTFFLIILVAALRSTDIAIDLAGHYARDYEVIAKSGWNAFPQLVTLTGYDPGFIVFCKLIGYISADPQCFVAITSIFIYFSVAVYIYKYSDDVVLETFLFITSFMYFMYMNIIAQAIAAAILMWAMKFLIDKKYVYYFILAIIAVSIHGSAWLILLYIPLEFLKPKRYNIVAFIAIVIMATLGYNKIISILINTVFKQFSFYFTNGNIHGLGQAMDLYTFCHLMIYVLAICLAFIFIYYHKEVQLEPARIIKGRGRRILEIPQISSNFLVYMTICAIVFRVMATKIYVVSRMGYYTYFFGLTLIVRSLNKTHGKQRIILKMFVYVIFLLFFLKNGMSAGKLSYGVVPYKFWWK
ncbi:MAG: EpsG family protein [Anaerobutyricum soehngenii]